jgi:hypothetical protein
MKFVYSLYPPTRLHGATRTVVEPGRCAGCISRAGARVSFFLRACVSRTFAVQFYLDKCRVVTNQQELSHVILHFYFLQTGTACQTASPLFLQLNPWSRYKSPQSEQLPLRKSNNFNTDIFYLVLIYKNKLGPLLLLYE